MRYPGAAFITGEGACWCTDLLEACAAWISWSLGEIADPFPKGGVPVSLEPGWTAAAFRGHTGGHSARDWRKAAGAGQGKRRTYRQEVLTSLTSNFLHGKEDVADAYNGFKSFRSRPGLLPSPETNPGTGATGSKVSECLLLALAVPVENVSRACTASRQKQSVDDEILNRLEKRLLPSWSVAPPSDFGVAVQVARQGGYWGTLDILRGKHKPQDVFTAKKFREDSFEKHRVYILNELLEVLYPLACRATWAIPNDQGRRLFLWLILGGVSHTKKSEERAEAAPQLVQPALIAALMDRFGKNFARDYQNRISRTVLY